MLHSLEYARFKEILQRSCDKNGVRIIEVNPAYTSKIGKQTYAKPFNLTVHEAASYVIARRGLGFQDMHTKSNGTQITL